MKYRIEDLIKSEVRGMLAQTFTTIPAIVDNYDSVLQTVDVRCCTEIPMFNGINMAQHTLSRVPLIFPQGSDWVMAGPLVPGDAVMLLISHYGIEEYLQGNKDVVANPEIPIYHDINECVAIPGMFTLNSQTRKSEFKDIFHIVQGTNHVTMDEEKGIEEQSPVKITMINNDNDITMDDNGIVIQSPTEVKIESGSSIITIEPGGTIKIDTSTVDINATLVDIDAGTVDVSGNLIVGGTVTATGDVTGAGVSLSTHTHGGVQGGGSNTSPPN